MCLMKNLLIRSPFHPTFFQQKRGTIFSLFNYELIFKHLSGCQDVFDVLELTVLLSDSGMVKETVFVLF